MSARGIRVASAGVFGITVLLAVGAGFLTYRVVKAPYGMDINALTSDSTYFAWSPLDTLPGQPGVVALGRSRTIYHRLPRFDLPWVPDVRQWSDSLMGNGSGTLERIDSLLVWWHGVFASYPKVSDVVPAIIPFGFAAPSTEPAICVTQVLLFQPILLSHGIHTRWAHLSDELGSPTHVGHTVVEVWVSEWRKWVLIDPMFANRYSFDGMPLAGYEMARLYRNDQLGDVTVEHLGTKTRFADYRFPMQYLGNDTMAVYFKRPGLWIRDRFVPNIRNDEPRYYLSWSATAGEFEPVPSEQRRFWLRVGFVAVAWLVVIVVAVLALRYRRRVDARRGYV